jgi:hypothetical protein
MIRADRRRDLGQRIVVERYRGSIGAVLGKEEQETIGLNVISIILSAHGRVR